MQRQAILSVRDLWFKRDRWIKPPNVLPYCVPRHAKLARDGTKREAVGVCGLDREPPLLLSPQAARNVTSAWRALGSSACILPLPHGDHALETRSEARATPPRVPGGLDHATVSRHDDRTVKSFLHLNLRASDALTQAPRIKLQQLAAESDRVVTPYDTKVPHAESPLEIQLGRNRAVCCSRGTGLHCETSIVSREVFQQNSICVGEVPGPRQTEFHGQSVLQHAPIRSTRPLACGLRAIT